MLSPYNYVLSSNDSMCNTTIKTPTAAAMHSRKVSRLSGSSSWVLLMLHLFNESAVPLDG